MRGRRPDRVVALPAAATDGGLSLEATLARRHSIREFAATALTTSQLGQLLWAAQGVTRSWGGRTAPSAGALYPLEVYVTLPTAVWHYLPAGHRVEEWDITGLRSRLAAAALGQSAVSTAPAVFVIAGVVGRTRGKYGARADRYVSLEAGHCAENLLLQATALGLGAVPIGAFDDDGIRQVLAMSRAMTPYYLVPVGPVR